MRVVQMISSLCCVWGGYAVMEISRSLPHLEEAEVSRRLSPLDCRRITRMEVVDCEALTPRLISGSPGVDGGRPAQRGTSPHTGLEPSVWSFLDKFHQNHARSAS